MTQLWIKLIHSLKTDGFFITSKKVFIKGKKYLLYAKQSQVISDKAAQNDVWDVLDKWIDNVPHKFIDIFHVPMGWNTPLFQRFQHISLQAGTIGGVSFYGAHPLVDTDVVLYKFVTPTLCIVNLDNFDVKQKFFEVLDKKQGLKIVRLQSIDLATRIEELESLLERSYSIVYEYIDEITPQITGNIPSFVFDRHEYVLGNENISVIATSDKLYSQVKRYRSRNFEMINNGVDYEHWQIGRDDITCPDDLRDIVDRRKIIVGYHGALAQWVDFELLKKIASSQRFVVLLIGHVHDDSMKKSGVLEQENIYYLGSKSYFELNKYAAFYDIGILPFMVNELTLSVSPVKIFEYMAAGKPVVSYALPECLKYESCLCANSQKDFLDKIDRAVELMNNHDYLMILRRDALSNTWTEIARKTIEVVSENRVKSEAINDGLLQNKKQDQQIRYIKQILHISDKESKDYVEISTQPYCYQELDAKVIAYYLTQFHPTEHNDRWWGRGTTEWNNVVRAVPQYIGHYQPRLPGELGFYDLRLRENMVRQVELAKMYGVYGFSFYYYWFDGERLLEKPLEMFLKDKFIEFPFSLCWANENWTKRFDGTNTDILMEQSPSPQSYQNVIEDISRFFRDERYIAVDGKKLLSIYRPSLMPSVKIVLNYWRKYCREKGLGELYLVAVKENTVETDWIKLGYDAVSEFHPGTLYTNCKNITNDIEYIREDFKGEVFDYKDIVYGKKYFNYNYHKLYRAVMPMWDNTARRNNKGMIFEGATPTLYKSWLKDVILEAQNRHDLDDNLIFINAWNEWGEGAYLEPDKRYGYAYLQATKEAVEETRK